jgi:phosphoglycerate dehydrogenase-like enzyme
MSSGQNEQSGQGGSDGRRRKIVVLPHGSAYQDIMSPRAEAVLRSLGEVVQIQGPEHKVTAEELSDLLPGADAVLTSWNAAPKFDEQLLLHADRLKIIGHIAGTVKGFIPPEVFDRGIAVTHAAGTIAESVGEWALMVALMSLRKGYEFNQTMQQGIWGKREMGPGRTLIRKRIGVVAASMTGRVFLRLLRGFDADVLVYDPYLTAAQAQQMGARKVDDLAEIFATCDVVSNHAPTTEETTGMITAEMIASMKDGALFVNTARANAVDFEALTGELVSGRIFGALDVFPKEPLAADSPLRGLPNVILSPHAAGGTVESRDRLGETVVDDVARFFRGEPMHYQITKEKLATMA